jgi:hypothetical protein
MHTGPLRMGSPQNEPAHADPDGPPPPEALRRREFFNILALHN